MIGNEVHTCCELGLCLLAIGRRLVIFGAVDSRCLFVLDGLLALGLVGGGGIVLRHGVGLWLVRLYKSRDVYHHGEDWRCCSSWRALQICFQQQAEICADQRC